MKLLAKTEAYNHKKKENDSLLETNLRLKKREHELRQKLATAKDDYEPEKVKKMQEFEVFCQDINFKKSQMLKELNDIQIHINSKKEIIYELVERQDEIQERLHFVEESEKKLELREKFVQDLERKWNEKQL